jgi:hypothetical protein
MAETKMEALDIKTSGKLIAVLSRNATAVEVKELPGDGRELLIHNHATGAYEVRSIPPACRNHRVFSVESFLAAARDEWDGVSEDAAVVWHGRDSVVLVFDDGDRRDRLTLDLPASEPFTWLTRLAERPEPMDQGTLVRVLRLRLGQPAELVGRFRRLDFDASRKGVAAVEHGRESLGREIVAAVQGLDALPDVIQVSVPVTDVPGANRPDTIRVGLEIDAQREQFYLAPMPGEMIGAVDRMHAELHATLAGGLAAKKIPVYYGSPS